MLQKIMKINEKCSEMLLKSMNRPTDVEKLQLIRKTRDIFSGGFETSAARSTGRQFPQMTEKMVESRRKKGAGSEKSSLVGRSRSLATLGSRARGEEKQSERSGLW
jgi:hypothetical protein